MNYFDSLYILNLVIIFNYKRDLRRNFSVKMGMGTDQGEQQSRPRPRLQRQTTVLEDLDDSWKDVKGKIFRVASVVVLPKNKRTLDGIPSLESSRSDTLRLKSLKNAAQASKRLGTHRSAELEHVTLQSETFPSARPVFLRSQTVNEARLGECFADEEEGPLRQELLHSDEPLPKARSFMPTPKSKDLPHITIKESVDVEEFDEFKEYEDLDFEAMSEEDEESKIRHSDLYNCMPPPIFMFTITMIELGFFIYHTGKLKKDPRYGYIGKYGPAPLDSTLIYNPTRRYEIWRYFTYAFVHSGYMHIINNLVVQLILGILLELVHKWWRVLAIYFAGVLAGSLATSISEPFNYLAGASAGVYALIAAHVSTVILNWTEMEHPWVRIFVFVAFAIHDAGTAVYFAYVVGERTNVGYAAHLGGAVAGLLVGIYVLKNIQWNGWETVLWYMSVVICSILLIFAIVWNVVRTDLFP